MAVAVKVSDSSPWDGDRYGVRPRLAAQRQSRVEAWPVASVMAVIDDLAASKIQGLAFVVAESIPPPAVTVNCDPITPARAGAILI